jgi:uncharacterized membrane protein YhiD involved in acid resistance
MINFFALYTKIENPTIEMVFFTFLLSFCLSGLIAFTYQKTGIKSTNIERNFLQSLILGSLIATMVLQVIGDNVASGLAMLGALNIVQFRTKLRTPRESIFMFSALGVGIACGLFGFFVAILGCFAFCLVAYTMRFTPLQEQAKKPKKMECIDCVLKIGSDEHIRLNEVFNGIMKEYCASWLQEGVVYSQTTAFWRDYTFALALKDITKQQDFLHALELIDMKIAAFEVKPVLKKINTNTPKQNNYED